MAQYSLPKPPETFYYRLIATNLLQQRLALIRRREVYWAKHYSQRDHMATTGQDGVHFFVLVEASVEHELLYRRFFKNVINAVGVV